MLFNDPRTKRVPDARQKGVRKIFTRSKRTARSYFPSRKMGQRIPVESTLEEAFVYHLETDPRIVSFRSQPRQLNLWVDGVVRKHFPDFGAETKEFETLIEIKPEKRAARPEYQACFEASARALESENLQYRLFTETWICREPALTNAKLICRYATDWSDPEVELLVMERLEAGNDALCDIVRDDRKVHGALFDLCRRGRLSFDRESSEINENTVFYKAAIEPRFVNWGRKYEL